MLCVLPDFNQHSRGQKALHSWRLMFAVGHGNLMLVFVFFSPVWHNISSITLPFPFYFLRFCCSLVENIKSMKIVM